MKNKFLVVLLVSLLFAKGLLLSGCYDGCKNDGNCVIRDYLGNRQEFNNCVMLLCDVSNSHLDNPSPSHRHVKCSCQ